MIFEPDAWEADDFSDPELGDAVWVEGAAATSYELKPACNFSSYAICLARNSVGMVAFSLADAIHIFSQ